MHMFGSGVLIRSLLEADLLDRLHLWLYPLTLGQGKRLFDAWPIATTFRLAEPARSFPKGCGVAGLRARGRRRDTRHGGQLDPGRPRAQKTGPAEAGPVFKV